MKEAMQKEEKCGQGRILSELHTNKPESKNKQTQTHKQAHNVMPFASWICSPFLISIMLIAVWLDNYYFIFYWHVLWDMGCVCVFVWPLYIYNKRYAIVFLAMTNHLIWSFNDLLFSLSSIWLLNFIIIVNNKHIESNGRTYIIMLIVIMMVNEIVGKHIFSCCWCHKECLSGSTIKVKMLSQLFFEEKHRDILIQWYLNRF